jgi:hypothetical protein
VAPRDAFVATLESAKQALRHIRIALIEEFDFPASLGLTRADLLQAADVTVLMSSYESFGIASVEGVPHGAVAVVSSAAGSCSWIQQNRPDVLTSHPSIVVADYLETYNDLLRAGIPAQRVEQMVAARAARAVLNNLTVPSETRIVAGRQLVYDLFDWEDAGQAFARCVRPLF